MAFFDKDEKGRGPWMRFITRDVIDMDEVAQTQDVLLVCEEAYMLQFMTNVVDGCGTLIPHTASNGNEALQKIAEVKPMVVVLDYDLTAPSAMETMEQMRKVDPKLHILFCIEGGRKGKNTAKEFLAAGASDWIDKPITSTVLVEKLLRLVDQRIKADKEALKNEKANLNNETDKTE